MEDEKKKQISDEIVDSAIIGAAADTVQRYGSAIKEYNVALTGVDNEAGTVMKKSLSSVSKMKINPDNKAANTSQQAGFSAEILDSAKTNAENKIQGSGNTKVRTDDIGKVNDPQYDHVVKDAAGNIIDGSGTQMKFVGKNPDEALSKLCSKGYDKYFEADTPIEVPNDFYEGIIKSADEKLAAYQKQLENQIKKGNKEQIDKIKKKIHRLEKIKKNVKPSKVTKAEAEFARLHPKLATAKYELQTAHRAGMEQGKIGAGVSGAMSLVRNFKDLYSGEKDIDEAAFEIVVDTGKGFVKSYSTASSGSLIKGAMQNSKSKILQNVSKTNAPAVIVQAAVTVGSSIKSYIKGDIDGAECIDQMGREGFGLIGSTVLTSLNLVALPATAPAAAVIAAGMAVSMVGYIAATAIYDQLKGALLEAKMAREERIRIEAECAEAVRAIREYREEINRIVENYLSSHYDLFGGYIESMDQAIIAGDTNGFIRANNAIMETFGKKPQFSSQEEFDSLILSGTKIVL